MKNKNIYIFPETQYVFMGLPKNICGADVDPGGTGVLPASLSSRQDEGDFAPGRIRLYF